MTLAVFDVLFKCAYPETDKRDEYDVTGYGSSFTSSFTGHTESSAPNRRVDTSHVPKAFQYQHFDREEVILKSHHVYNQESGMMVIEEDKQSVTTGFTGMTGRWARASTLNEVQASEQTPELLKEDVSVSIKVDASASVKEDASASVQDDATVSVKEQDKESVKEADVVSVSATEESGFKEAEQLSVKQPLNALTGPLDFDRTSRDCQTQKSTGLSTVKSYVFDVDDN